MAGPGRQVQTRKSWLCASPSSSTSSNFRWVDASHPWWECLHYGHWQTLQTRCPSSLPSQPVIKHWSYWSAAWAWIRHIPLWSYQLFLLSLKRFPWLANDSHVKFTFCSSTFKISEYIHSHPPSPASGSCHLPHLTYAPTRLSGHSSATLGSLFCCSHPPGCRALSPKQTSNRKMAICSGTLHMRASRSKKPSPNTPAKWGLCLCSILISPWTCSNFCFVSQLREFVFPTKLFI